MENVTFKGELILTLESKQDMFRKFKNPMPEKRKSEQWIWLDKNGNHVAIGQDFTAAEKAESFPVKVYRLQRVAEFQLSVTPSDRVIRAGNNQQQS